MKVWHLVALAWLIYYVRPDWARKSLLAGLLLFFLP